MRNFMITLPLTKPTLVVPRRRPNRASKYRTNSFNTNNATSTTFASSFMCIAYDSLIQPGISSLYTEVLVKKKWLQVTHPNITILLHKIPISLLLSCFLYIAATYVARSHKTKMLLASKRATPQNSIAEEEE